MMALLDQLYTNPQAGGGMGLNQGLFGGMPAMGFRQAAGQMPSLMDRGQALIGIFPDPQVPQIGLGQQGAPGQMPPRVGAPPPFPQQPQINSNQQTQQLMDLGLLVRPQANNPFVQAMMARGVDPIYRPAWQQQQIDMYGPGSSGYGG